MNEGNKKPIEIRDAILQCLIDDSTVIGGDSDENKRKSAEDHLAESFFIVGGDYYNPDYESMLKVLKVLATKEMKTGKDRSIISKNYMQLANEIKSAQTHDTDG